MKAQRIDNKHKEEGKSNILPSFVYKIETNVFIKPVTNTQRQFVKSIKANDLVVAVGPAGTGKTLNALHTAVQLLNNEWSSIEKIVYVRAAINSDQERDVLGILPGGYEEKIMPLCYPILDNMSKFVPMSLVKYVLEKGIIEVMPTSMMRGRSFSNTFILVDEASNISPAGIKTALTRLGEGSKMVIIGDPSQKDTRDNVEDGLADLAFKLKVKGDIEGVDLIQFTNQDIVRHHLIARVLDLYS